MSNYYDWNCFKGVYLEDSFVLTIKESANEVVFFLEAVLTEENPHYENPKDSEKYCYKNARVVFKNVEYIRWVQKNIQEFIDADGYADLGNIDLFQFKDNKYYYLTGDWGEVWIKSAPVIFLLEEKNLKTTESNPDIRY